MGSVLAVLGLGSTPPVEEEELGGAPFECPICLEFLDAPAPGDGVIVLDPKFSEKTHRNVRLHELQKSQDEIVASVCGHLFHSYCIGRWFAGHPGRICPFCRKNAGKVNVVYPNLGSPLTARRKH